MSKKLLIVHKIPGQVVEKLQDEFTITYPDNDFFTKEELIEIIPGQDAILSMFSQPLDKEIITKADKLKIIANFGVGYNNIDVQFATSKKICVTNTPNAVTRPTAELCLGLMLNVARGISQCDRKLRNKNGLRWGVMENLGVSLENKKLGIIGMGKIGQEVARLAAQFSMQIKYFDSKEFQNLPFSAKYSPFNDLLEQSDFISLHVPLTDKTRHLIGKAEFKLMQEHAFLINTSRGAVVNEQDLIYALTNKQLAGAALDVFEHEPTIPEEFKKLDNLVMVPHIGTATIDTRIAMANEALDNIRDYFADKTPQSSINPEIF